MTMPAVQLTTTLTTTDITILFATVIIMVLDFVFLAQEKGGMQSTISARIAYWSVRYPLVPFLVGLLMGHLFWVNRAYCL